MLPVELAKRLGRFDLDDEVGHCFSKETPGWISGLVVGTQPQGGWGC